MKLKLLFAFVTLFFMSCSGDDSDTVDTVPVVAKKLDKVVYLSYNNEAVARRQVAEFNDNNQIISEITYGASDEILSKSEFMYDSSGVLKTRNDYYSYESLETPSYNYNFSYDTQNRLNKAVIHLSLGQTQTIIYTYSDNTITAISDNNSEVIYELNSNGQIIKKTVEGNYTDEFMYEGSNVVFYGGTSHSPHYTYEYDMENQPVGEFMNIAKNQYGSINNAIMIKGFNNGLYSSNYLTAWSISTGEPFYVLTYEFDAEGYPVKVNRSFSTATTPAYVTEISYK